jgi:glycosyltransferase involved in cell wall biosynthesis
MTSAASNGAWPRVSAVVATRDRPELLRRSLEAILGQRYPGELECVVVFDQSEPNLPDLDVPENRELRAVTNVRSPGLAGARNSGTEAATGELVAFCDDDDVWLPDKLRLQVPLLRSAERAVVASCGLRIKYEGRSVVRLPDDQPVTFRDLLRSRRAEIHPSSVVVRREDLLGRVGLVDEHLPGSYAEDYEWLLRATRHGDVVSVPKPLLDVYWHRASYFAGRWETIADSLTYLLDRYPEFRTDRKGLARILGQIAFARAASGRTAEARSTARGAARANWAEPRAYLALLVTLGVPADGVLRLAHKVGRGI